VTAIREKWEKEKLDFLSQLAGPSATSEDTGSNSSSLQDLDENLLKNDDESNHTDETIVEAASIATEPTDNEDGAVMDDPSKTIKLVTLLEEKLPECVSKQRADEFCVSFCHISTKNARKRLAQSMVRLPRSRSELSSTYARIVASLSRIYPEMVQPILDGLNKDFYGILKAKNQLHIESKVKNVRYVGELIKFRVAPPIMALRMFKSLLIDFSNHNVQLLAVLLETCGRFLYVLPYTHDRIEEVLTDMIRIRRSRNLDLHQQNLLEAAYFAVKPPDRTSKVVKKQLSVVQQYARYLILEQLDEKKNVDIDSVIKSLRRLPWKDEQENVVHHIIKAALKIARTKYTTIPNLADCLSGLATYQPCLLTILVDRILEEVQRAIESPFKREMQRMIGFIRLLGELYNFTAISSIIIFDLLHHLINFGHEDISATNESTQLIPQSSIATNGTVLEHVHVSIHSARITQQQQKRRYDPRILSDTDPVNDLFRAQLVCELLNTCGMYYVRGKLKEQLSRFLIYFQRYLLTKQFIPLHVEFTILDTFDLLEDLAKEAQKEALLKASKAAKNSGGASVINNDSYALTTAGWIFPRFDHFDKVQQIINGFEELSMNQLDSGEDMNNDQEAYRGDDDEEEEEEDDEADGEEENKVDSDNDGEENTNNEGR
jgi:regulator of nonsense transcripts 2